MNIKTGIKIIIYDYLIWWRLKGFGKLCRCWNWKAVQEGPLRNCKGFWVFEVGSLFEIRFSSVEILFNAVTVPIKQSQPIISRSDTLFSGHRKELESLVVIDGTPHRDNKFDRGSCKAESWPKLSDFSKVYPSFSRNPAHGLQFQSNKAGRGSCWPSHRRPWHCTRNNPVPLAVIWSFSVSAVLIVNRVGFLAVIASLADIRRDLQNKY